MRYHAERADSFPRTGDEGFTLVEFLAASAVLLVVAGSVFTVLADIQRTAGYQGEIQTVLENTRIAIDTVTRNIRQCGNDPLGTGLEGIRIVDGSRVQLRSDLTGSAGPANPDKGDPDGDTLDANEDITLSHNRAARTLEIAGTSGAPQVVATNISALSLEYLDGTGRATAAGNEVRSVRVSLTGTSNLRDPRTGRYFSLSVTSDVQIVTRQ